MSWRSSQERLTPKDVSKKCIKKEYEKIIVYVPSLSLNRSAWGRESTMKKLVLIKLNE